MRRVLIVFLILLLPIAISAVMYLTAGTKPIPTNPDAVGMVTTLAGTGEPGVFDGPAPSARFSDPFGLAVDKDGNLFVSDGGDANRIRFINMNSGSVETISGSAEGFANSEVSSALFNTPSGIAVDELGRVIIADTANNRIRRIEEDGTVSTVAGTGAIGFKDGAAGEAEFDAPVAVAVDNQGNIVVADTYNDRIRRISPDGTVTTLAGNGVKAWSDGPALAASFDTPCGVAVDGQGNVFVADTGNDAIRMVSTFGEVTTVAGGFRGRSDGRGTGAGFDQPTGIAVTHDGFLFVTDAGSGLVRRITPEGEVNTFAGSRAGFANGIGSLARFNGPTGIAIDRVGNIYVADTRNYLVRRLAFISTPPRPSDASSEPFIQPSAELHEPSDNRPVPDLGKMLSNVNKAFPWPLNPQGSWHEITGVVGEARGALGGIALHHLHSGVDIRGQMGEQALSVRDEKVSSPIANWDFGGIGEGIQVGLISYIHIQVGRGPQVGLQRPEKFKAQFDENGRVIGIRARRGARFEVGDFLGSLNSLYHVHLNVGPWNGEVNPLHLPFAGLKDTVAPVIESNGIEVQAASGELFKEMDEGRLVVFGDIDIVVSAFDRVDGNEARRRLGLYRVGYQLLQQDGTPVAGFEEPLINIDFSRLPPEDNAVFLAYAPGSGVSAYGGATRFKYLVTNRVRGGEARDGFLQTAAFPEGNYVIRIIAEDQAGNRTAGPSTELLIKITRR